MAHVFYCENIKEGIFVISFQDEKGGQNTWVKFSICTLVAN